ncbi:NAD-dependent protein deacylase Sirt4-like [Bolinopsis microptera]|uniref:NAD-dependent protein deacylase Sirt4-like n=1 Tax=Bolinopsis microptera TaxID=2820187 RepID=UPI003079E6EC
MQHCVPKHAALLESQYRALEEFILSARRLLVLTGAGLSTESGIPDYRSEGVGLYDRTKHRPIQHMEFMTDSQARRRYWARNYIGFPVFISKVPNTAHKILAEMEKSHQIDWLVTQNVDRLHQKAGSNKVTELHGTTNIVACQTCNYVTDRESFQRFMHTSNKEFTADIINVTPDADAEIDVELIKKFNTPLCPDCGSDLLKPQVVFFGSNVVKEKVAHCYDKLHRCDKILVAGSSLQVMSGYRFLLEANRTQKPIAVLNIGETRGDHLANVKVTARCGEFFERYKTLNL